MNYQEHSVLALVYNNVLYSLDHTEVDGRVYKTEGESSSRGQKTRVEYRERPLPPTPPTDHQQQVTYHVVVQCT